MRWEGERQSDNVQYRRGQGGRFGGVAMRRGGTESRQLSDCGTFPCMEP
jgi:predicted metalloprotease